jgi:hypothetical protein
MANFHYKEPIGTGRVSLLLPPDFASSTEVLTHKTMVYPSTASSRFIEGPAQQTAASSAGLQRWFIADSCGTSCHLKCYSPVALWAGTTVPPTM